MELSVSWLPLLIPKVAVLVLFTLQAGEMSAPRPPGFQFAGCLIKTKLTSLIFFSQT